MGVENHLISVYSVISAILFFNVALAVVYLLRRKNSFIASYGIYTVLFRRQAVQLHRMFFL